MNKVKEKVMKNKGISLIVLIITIIIIVILATAIILSVASNNPIDNATEAKFKSDVKSIQEELELLKASNYANNNGVNFYNKDGTEITIDNLESASKYSDKFKIVDGELKVFYVKLTQEERVWIKDLGIDTVEYVFKNGENDVTIVDGNFSTEWYYVSEGTITNTPPELVGKTVIIPEGVTTIGNNSFFQSQLSCIIIPSTVINLGSSSFNGISTDITKIIIEGEIRFTEDDIRSAFCMSPWSDLSGLNITIKGYLD